MFDRHPLRAAPDSTVDLRLLFCNEARIEDWSTGYQAVERSGHERHIHRGEVTHLVRSGSLVLSASRDILHCWRYGASQHANERLFRHGRQQPLDVQDPVRTLSLNPSATQAMYVQDSGAVRVWDVDTNKNILARSFRVFGQSDPQCALSQHVLAIANTEKLQLLDLRDFPRQRKTVDVPGLHKEDNHYLLFACKRLSWVGPQPDSMLLYVGTSFIQVWDTRQLDAGPVQVAPHECGRDCAGHLRHGVVVEDAPHQCGILTSAVSHDGLQLAVALADRTTIQVYSIGDGCLLTPSYQCRLPSFENFLDISMCLSFSADDRHLVTSGIGRTWMYSIRERTWHLLNCYVTLEQGREVQPFGGASFVVLP
eukprot:GILJ01012075.1.p1 GENE.GILJ01012075.1~~GILJ01012075.1.p1  ORF type:complete len:367 (+),score=12.27 GILJ01012075.1:117-1217(+)